LKDNRPPEGSPKTVCAFLIGYLGGINPNLGPYAPNQRLISHFCAKQEKKLETLITQSFTFTDFGG